MSAYLSIYPPYPNWQLSPSGVQDLYGRLVRLDRWGWQLWLRYVRHRVQRKARVPPRQLGRWHLKGRVQLGQELLQQRKPKSNNLLLSWTEDPQVKGLNPVWSTRKPFSEWKRLCWLSVGVWKTHECTLKILYCLSEFGGLWKHENNQHALVPLKTECGCPSGEEMKNSHIWKNAEIFIFSWFLQSLQPHQPHRRGGLYGSVVSESEFKSEDLGFDPLAGQGEQQVFCPSESILVWT